MAEDEKLKPEEYKKMAEHIKPYLQERYGKSALIKWVKFLRGNPEGLEYRVRVEYRRGNKKRGVCLEVDTPLASDVPLFINGKATVAGEAWMNYLSDLGDFMGDVYDGD